MKKKTKKQQPAISAEIVKAIKKLQARGGTITVGDSRVPGPVGDVMSALKAHIAAAEDSAENEKR